MDRKACASKKLHSDSRYKRLDKVVESSSHAKHRILKYILLALAVGLVCGLAIFAVGLVGNQPTLTSTQSQTTLGKPAEISLFNHGYQSDAPRDFIQMLKLPPEEIEQLDIALINLLCAQNLPDAKDLDIDGILATLDQWAAHVERETNRNLYKFYKNPAEYDNSEARWRMAVLVTVLQQDCGVHYNLERVHEVDFTHSEDLFIHGMVKPGMMPVQAVSDPEGAQVLHDSTNGGTCISMPVVYTATARRLGYPVSLSMTKAHIFCRWDGTSSGGHANPRYRDYFNIEGSSRGFNLRDDAYYLTFPEKISPDYAAANDFLESQTNLEALAGFLATRGHYLLDIGWTPEAYNAYTAAVRRHPGQPQYRQFMKHAHAQWDREQQRLAAGNPREYDPQRHLEETNRINAENGRRQEDEWRRHGFTDASVPVHFMPSQAHQSADLFAPSRQGF